MGTCEHGAPLLNKPLPLVCNYYNSKYTVRKEEFEEGHHNDRDLVIRQINAWPKRIQSDIALRYHPYKHMFHWMGSSHFKLCFFFVFFPRMAYMLGLRPSKPGPVSSPYPPDIKAGFYHFFCCMNLVQHQMVGDSYTLLLRMIPIEGKFGDIVTKPLTQPTTC